MVPDSEFRSSFEKKLRSIRGKDRDMDIHCQNWDMLIPRHGLHFVIPVCPLYQEGPINESRLLAEATSIEGSRVSGKWLAVRRLLDVVTEYCTNINVSVAVVFADLGVISTDAENGEISRILDRHSLIYSQAVEEVRQLYDRIQFRYSTYRELSVKCDLTISTKEPCPDDLTGFPLEKRVIEWAKRKLQISNLSFTRKNLALIPELVNSFGESLTVGCLYSYLAPDQALSKLGTLMVNIERKRSPLFEVARFDLHSWQAATPTIEIGI